MIQDILDTYWGDYQKDPHPKDRRMLPIRDHLTFALNGENVYFLINELVRRYAKTYLEVGVLHGGSLFSAAIYNEDVRCIGIDCFDSPFSTFSWGKPDVIREAQKKNLEYFKFKNVEIHEGDFRDVIPKLFNKEPSLKVDVYYYDALFSYEDEYDGLSAMVPYMSDNCIICTIAGDKLPHLKSKAVREFLKSNPAFTLVSSKEPDWSSETSKWSLDSNKESWNAGFAEGGATSGFHIITRGTIEQK